ncbi:uncharacterized protein KY384_005535 [Bacidia gigantensis]|uniref:uncharacterized protein n=1 Tax=Bacidia gigantensis TaxID=2732470 RepID=UPI001D049D49|nr:uncharacterized protein KY384_005535 [Bacidia gigantensis]KAG8530053.1 hypothetical protein KY384_005535 [Bacidia gigantensis]
MTITYSRFIQPADGPDTAEGKRTPKPPPRIWHAIEPPFKGEQPLPTNAYSQSSRSDAIIIDNGSSEVRAGFSNSPRPLLAFPADAARYRDRKINRTVTYVGYNAYADATTRGQIKKAFEPGTSVVGNWDVMESVLDQIFVGLGVDNGDAAGVGRSIVMTEPIAALGYTRKTMNELLFECYGAPSVAYGIDSLFSYRQNKGSSGLLISSAHSATHVVPVVGGKPIMSSVSRLNWGGYQNADYLMKLLRLKYPLFPAQIKDYQVEQMARDHCYVSQDYQNEMNKFLDWTGLEERDHIIQYPFTEHIVVEKSQEELDRVAEKKRLGGIRLQEQAAKMRFEKLVQKEQELEYYKDLQVRLQGQTKKEIKRLLDDDELKDESQLDKLIKDLEKRVRKARNKDLGVKEPEEEETAQSFPLLDTPDDQLDEAGLKQKRHQRLMKSGLEARQRAKAEKEQERARQAEAQRLDEERRENDIEGWLQSRREARSALLQRIKDRDRLARDQGNRKSLASQMRMKTLASLASDQPGRKRRRGGGDDDDFGANDEDWGVYRTVAMGEPASDEEEEDDLDGDMKKLESELLEHDPHFSEAQTMGAQKDWTKSLLHAFLRGPRPFDGESMREKYQLHLNVERIRVPEVVFQPSIAGVDQAGLVDIAAGVVESGIRDVGDRGKVLRDVFLTGGNTLFEGFEERLKRDLRALLPDDAVVGMRRAKDPLLDAWKGAAAWAKEPGFKAASVSRAEYDERGSEYMKEHNLGNIG